jgi:hypothetical protein
MADIDTWKVEWVGGDWEWAVLRAIGPGEDNIDKLVACQFTSEQEAADWIAWRKALAAAPPRSTA